LEWYFYLIKDIMIMEEDKTKTTPELVPTQSKEQLDLF